MHKLYQSAAVILCSLYIFRHGASPISYFCPKAIAFGCFVSHIQKTGRALHSAGRSYQMYLYCPSYRSAFSAVL